MQRVRVDGVDLVFVSPGSFQPAAWVLVGKNQPQRYVNE